MTAGGEERCRKGHMHKKDYQALPASATKPHTQAQAESTCKFKREKKKAQVHKK